jgi:hypothetical protein
MIMAIPQPLGPGEAIDTSEAAARAGVSERTVREWCVLHQIGRRCGGRWRVSAVALDMLVNGDDGALNAYLEGDRRSEVVRAYFARQRVPLPDAVSSRLMAGVGSSAFEGEPDLS